jgi:hypothetical protein
VFFQQAPSILTPDCRSGALVQFVCYFQAHQGSDGVAKRVAAAEQEPLGAERRIEVNLRLAEDPKMFVLVGYRYAFSSRNVPGLCATQ